MEHKITSFYTFFEKKDINSLFHLIQKKTRELDLKGIVLLAPEGINATVSGSKIKIEKFKDLINKNINVKITYKEADSLKPPFKRMKVKLKDEIITFDKNLKATSKNKLTPKEWNMALNSNKHAIVLDVRNWYETDLGKFKKAETLELDAFQEFLIKFKALNLSKEKQVYMYCTGGVRCEKASPALEKMGYKVFQLDGGILNYLKVYPEGDFKGECFVFDHRVSVDSKLNATKKYTLCPHCGQPAFKEYECLKCFKTSKVCDACINIYENQSCSKNCANQLKKLS